MKCISIYQMLMLHKACSSLQSPQLIFSCCPVSPSALTMSSLSQGDSGGPLLYNGVAVGITSNGGRKCGQVKKPGIYTIISHYTEWIDGILNPAATEQSS